MTLLHITHETRYEYAAPVTLAHHLAHLQPLHDEHQQRLIFDLDIRPAPDDASTVRLDVHGNAEQLFSLTKAHRALAVRATSRVRLLPRFAALDAAASPAWDALALSLRYEARAPYRPEVAYAMPSPYVPRLAPLRAWAARSFPSGRPVAEGALELMHRLHADFSYETGSSAVDTPLETVWTQRRGVCQDFAHLMAGAMRMLGLPVRYVSGYLLTHAPAGEAGAGRAMQGADASHAWVQVWCPGTPGVPADGWLDLDPTNDLVPGSGHVRVAVGRDFGDVTPLRGVIRGGAGHRLTVAVHTQVLEPERELLRASSMTKDQP